jgi:peptidoglycan-associated lipoprotein
VDHRRGSYSLGKIGRVKLRGTLRFSRFEGRALFITVLPEEEKMFRKAYPFFIVLVSLLAIALISGGCAKKAIVKEEAQNSPVKAKMEAPPQKPVEKPVVVAKPAPPPPEQPKVEALPKPKEEAAPKAVEKPAPLDLNSVGIHFAFDDYTLSTQAEKNLQKTSVWMKKDPTARIRIQGNTCDIGTAEYNLALGDRRANSAKMYLEALGVDSSRLSTISYGEEKPMVPNTNEANRSMNRRDDFVMVQ